MFERVREELTRLGGRSRIGVCAACEKPIKRGEAARRILGKLYHRNCAEYKSRRKLRGFRSR